MKEIKRYIITLSYMDGSSCKASVEVEAEADAMSIAGGWLYNANANLVTVTDANGRRVVSYSKLSK